MCLGFHKAFSPPSPLKTSTTVTECFVLLIIIISVESYTVEESWWASDAVRVLMWSLRKINCPSLNYKERAKKLEANGTLKSLPGST